MPKTGRSHAGMNNLRGIMGEEVARKGAISFERFMELALYCPKFGYYDRPDTSPGRRGDYFTSVSVGSLFGELLAGQFAEWRGNAECGVRSAQWQILEAGAHDGRLAADILRWLKAEKPDEFEMLEYWILEPSANRRAMQEKTLGEFAGKARWFDSWSALPQGGVNGVILSNELLDAMPVRRVGWDAERGKWFEWGVTLKGDEFGWTRMPEDDALEGETASWGLPPELLRVLPDGFATEIGDAAVDWWRQATRSLKQGKLLALDYGLTREEFFTPERKEGTLRAYYQHHLNTDLLARVGEQDITAQVNFSAVREAGETEGGKTERFVTQAAFLTEIVRAMSGKDPAFAEWISKRGRAFQTLTHPEHLGRPFRVLVQEK